MTEQNRQQKQQNIPTAPKGCPISGSGIFEVTCPGDQNWVISRTYVPEGFRGPVTLGLQHIRPHWYSTLRAKKAHHSEPPLGAYPSVLLAVGRLRLLFSRW